MKSKDGDNIRNFNENQREIEHLSKSSKMTVSGTISLKLDTSSNSVLDPLKQKKKN